MHGGHPFLRTLAVGLFASWCIASDVPQLAQLWHSYGINPYFASGVGGADCDWRAIALYGAHTSGEAIDPDELKLIEKIVAMSSAAVDHLEAIDMRRQNELLAGELAWYRAGAGQAAP
jgi:hypothetical protein